MDQIVAQALTTYAKIRGEKRAVAAAAGSGNARVTGNLAGNGNGHSNGNGKGRHAPSSGLLMTNP
jgi:hypothetical protein